MKKVFAVHDTKAAFFGNPMFLSTRGEAIRAFGDEANRPESMLFKHSSDFVLYEIGEYDELTGILNPQKHHCLGFASDFKDQSKAYEKQFEQVMRPQKEVVKNGEVIS